MNVRFSKEVPESINRAMDEHMPFWKVLSKESDRTIAIMAVCLFDNMLERMIQASYVKNPQVKSLFKNDHILQSFFSKINIAYFSGLIPDFVYHDLKLICEIRNRFAHALIADPKFTDKYISQRIDRLRLMPKSVMQLAHPRAKFTFVVPQIMGILNVLEHILVKSRPVHLVEVLNMSEATRPKWQLNDSDAKKFLRKR
jgi:DNA-binding MltR family transcriptional regulator